jgi:hypothetical protein
MNENTKHQTPNTKSQTPNKLQNPNTKLQRTAKHPTQVSGTCAVGWSLRFGISLVFGVWDLEF